MKLRLTRLWPSPERTLGALYVDGHFECFTLEDAVREPGLIPQGMLVEAWVRSWKIDKVTAIPIGEYKLVTDVSKRFQRLLPHLLDVPGFTGVRVHAGNTEVDTEGCILVGDLSADLTRLTDSRIALAQLMKKLGTGEHLIMVENKPTDT